MPKVLVESIRKPGRTKRVDGRLANALIRRGGWRYAEAAALAPPVEAPASLEDTPFNDLRRLAKAEGLELGRATKAEVIAALQAHRRGTYQRRDLRAEE